MPRKPQPITLDALPLFAEDREIAQAIVGPSDAKIANWLASLPLLERDGFPRRHPAYGRYVPSVKQFYERCYGCVSSQAAPHLQEVEKPWPRSRTSARRA